MTKHVLFLQGGGAGAYAEDAKLAAALQDALGSDYRVIYPAMPNEADPEYTAWQAQISKELAALEGKVILVGHSVGGAVLLRYLAEEHVKQPIAGIFIIAAPYWGAEDWQAALPKGVPLFLYHSRDDTIVPFAHQALWAKKLGAAVIREVTGGHQLNNDLAAVAKDITSV
jgi:predicted alpha/beta hydrolase family esterase